MGRFHYDKKGYPRWNDTNELVHRTVAKAEDGEVVHHKDGNKKNFGKDNLQIMSRRAHNRLHRRKRRK